MIAVPSDLHEAVHTQQDSDKAMGKRRYLCPPLSRGAVVRGCCNYVPSAVHVAEVASEDGGTSRQGLLGETEILTTVVTNTAIGIGLYP